MAARKRGPIGGKSASPRRAGAQRAAGKRVAKIAAKAKPAKAPAAKKGGPVGRGASTPRLSLRQQSKMARAARLPSSSKSGNGG